MRKKSLTNFPFKFTSIIGTWWNWKKKNCDYSNVMCSVVICDFSVEVILIVE